MGNEATWEWYLLIFIKSISSLDHISGWIYTQCQQGMCTRILQCDYGLGKGVCAYLCTLGCACLLFIVLLCWLWHFLVLSFMKKLHYKKKVWGICYFHCVRRFGLLLSACVYVTVLFSLNHGYNEIAEGKNMFRGPGECVLCFPFIFSIFYGVATMAFVYLLEKLKDMNIFLAPSIKKAQTKKKKRMAYWEQVMKGQCDLPSASKQWWEQGHYTSGF